MGYERGTDRCQTRQDSETDAGGGSMSIIDCWGRKKKGVGKKEEISSNVISGRKKR